MKELLRATTAYRSLLWEAQRGTCAHASLVVFPDEALLRALLKECAKAILSAEDGTRNERLIENEHLPDCMILPEAGGKLTAETGGFIVEESAMRPVEGDKKLFVLDMFHTVTPLVQNKLLKILEEPPEGVYFLIGTSNEYAVLPTVLSRVKRYAVPPFSEEQVAAALRRTHPFEKGIAEAAGACGGIYSFAESLLMGEGKLFSRAERFLSGEDTELFCRSLTDREEAKPFFAAVRLTLRDIALYQTGQARYASRKDVGQLAAHYPAGAALKGIALVDEAERQMAFNANFSQCALALAIGLDKEKKKWQRLRS